MVSKAAGWGTAGWAAAVASALLVVIFELVIERRNRGRRLGWVKKSAGEPEGPRVLVNLGFLLLFTFALHVIGYVACLITLSGVATMNCLRLVHNRRLTKRPQRT